MLQLWRIKQQQAQDRENHFQNKQGNLKMSPVQFTHEHTREYHDK